MGLSTACLLLCVVLWPFVLVHWFHSCVCVYAVFLQSCRLGQHRPISKGYPDGIVLVGSSDAKTLMDQPVSDWFLKAAGTNSDAFTRLKLYAQVCRHNLGRFKVAALIFIFSHVSSPDCSVAEYLA